MFYTRLTIFNGSPRGLKGNSRLITDQFINGLAKADRHEVHQHLLIKEKDIYIHLDKFHGSDELILVFPLYHDSMPAQVKAFIEKLEVDEGKKMPALGFIVHGGFPEAIHSRAVEKYLEKLAGRLGCRYIGTVVQGGSEGMRNASQKKWVKKVLNLYHDLGIAFGKTGEFDKQIVKKLAMPEKMPKLILPLMNLFFGFTFFQSYWNNMLKNNQAYSKRFDRPYLQKRQEEKHG